MSEILNTLFVFLLMIFGGFICFGVATLIQERNEARHKEKIRDNLDKDTQ